MRDKAETHGTLHTFTISDRKVDDLRVFGCPYLSQTGSDFKNGVPMTAMAAPSNINSRPADKALHACQRHCELILPRTTCETHKQNNGSNNFRTYYASVVIQHLIYFVYSYPLDEIFCNAKYRI